MKFVDSIWMLNKVLQICTMKITDNRWKERVDIQGSIPKKIFFGKPPYQGALFFRFLLPFHSLFVPPLVTFSLPFGA